jgi:hypothetical protein
MSSSRVLCAGESGEAAAKKRCQRGSVRRTWTGRGASESESEVWTRRSSESVLPDAADGGKSTARKWNPSFSDRESLSFFAEGTGVPVPGPGTMCDMECAHVVLVDAKELFAGGAAELLVGLAEGAPGLGLGTAELNLVALDTIVVELTPIVAFPPTPIPSVSLGHIGASLMMHALTGSGHRNPGSLEGVGVAPSSTVWVSVTVTTTLLVSLAAWTPPEISSCGRASVLASRVRRLRVV